MQPTQVPETNIHQHPTVSDEFIDILTEIFNIGTGRASSALSEMLGMPIELKVPKLHVLSAEQLRILLKEEEGSYVAVSQKMHGEVEGSGILSFPLMNGKSLIDNLINQSAVKANFGTYEAEAIQEVGNIIINAVGSSLSDILKLRVWYDIPQLHYSKFPIPEEFYTNGRPSIFCLAFSSFKVQNSDVEGIINFVFCYQNFEIFEKLFSRENRIFSAKFGEVALSEGIVSETELEHALKLQKHSCSFIGEILVEEGYISPDQKEIVLQSGDYKMFNQKFGDILLSEKAITTEQLMDALHFQKEARKFVGNLLGEILVKLSYITPEEKCLIVEKQTEKDQNTEK